MCNFLVEKTHLQIHLMYNIGIFIISALLVSLVWAGKFYAPEGDDQTQGHSSDNVAFERQLGEYEVKEI